MSDFTKNKIAFVVALLATLFTITPVITTIGTWGYAVFGFQINVNQLYYFTTIFFALAVYAYGIQFLTERQLKYTQLAGDIFYAVAIVAPPLFPLVYLFTILAESLGGLFRSPGIGNLLSNITSAILGAISFYLVGRIVDALRKKEQNSRAETLQREEIAILNRARQLFDGGFFDLSIVESFKAIEVAIRKALTKLGLLPNRQTPLSLIEQASKYNILPNNIIDNINQIRVQRNRIAHEHIPVTDGDAQEVLLLTDRVLAAVETSLGGQPVPSTTT